MDKKTANGYTAKVVKTFKGEDMPGYNATLYKDGKKIGEFDQFGNGAPLNTSFLGREAEKELSEYCKTLGKMPKNPNDGNDFEIDWDSELFMEELALDAMEEKIWKRKCATKTLFRLAGDAEDVYREIKSPYTPAFAQKIRDKYADKLIEIINERFLCLVKS